MVSGKRGTAGKQKTLLRFHILIFFVGLLFTITLWDAYFNGTRPFDKEVAAYLILIMGTLFSVAAGMFTWSIESRRDSLETDVAKRTHELHEKNDELLRKNEEIENFIHTISHDLKAPIVSIRGFASLLENELGSALEGVKADYFHRIVQNAKQMNMLIVDLLEFSRVGRVEDEKEAVNPKEVFDEMLSELKPEIDKKQIQITLSENFPFLFGSRKRLLQVFTNLVANAVKYMGSPAEPRIEIAFSEEPSASTCLLWVKDNGIGIKKEFQDKIFQIFQRAPNTLQVEGTGIGLSIVKKIVELNGGKVWVESEEGKGSQFFVRWPKAAASSVKMPGIREAAFGPALVHHAKGAR